jgi:copper transport protein
MTAALSRYRRAPLAIAIVIAALVSIGTGHVASAHTDFDSSNPTDGAAVDGPLSEVVVNFTNPARPAGDGFQLLDPTGAVRSPSSIDETDGTSFVLTFDPALEAGTYGLRWSVRAGDAHPIEGSFRFDVTGPSPSAAPAASGSEPAASSPATTHATGMDMTGADHVAMSDDALDAFLDVDSADNGSLAVGRAGRTMSMLAMIFGVGVLAALVWTLRGDRDELVTQLTWVRLAGFVVFTGGFVELAALTETDPAASLGTMLVTRPGTATALKMMGGLAILFGFHQRAGRIIAPSHSLSAAVATDLAPPTDARSLPSARQVDRAAEHRWTPTRTAAAGLVGYALVLVSFWFDGHTVSKGPWAIHSLVSLVHLGAAAVWGGGVFAMTTTAWMRRRRSERLGLAAMVVRFSSIATVALTAVIVAGVVMAWIVLDTPGDLFATPWGRILVAKTAVVAVAGGLGGYNHFRLRPALEQRPDDPQLAKELRISLSIESAVFVTIVVLTAILVASAT